MRLEFIVPNPINRVDRQLLSRCYEIHPTAWAVQIVRWYNVEHRHSGIGYVSPDQRHAGDDRAILTARHDLYPQARERYPAQWSGHTRNWAPVGAVTLNPERDSVGAKTTQLKYTWPSAA